MAVKGFAAYVLTIGVFLTLFAILGLLGSIDTMIKSENLGLLLFIGLLLMLGTIIFHSIEIRRL
jgi:hypothetical protein